MKDYLAQIVGGTRTPVQGRNAAREYLQARILEALQRAGAMIPLAFHGGTALRFLFASARYSEDLDFSLEQTREEYNWRSQSRELDASTPIRLRRGLPYYLLSPAAADDLLQAYFML
jgi:predicted nucleotidyltransferase component of viral defense system